MYLSIKKKREQLKGYQRIDLNSYSVYFQISKKEIVFENENFHVFLKTNYSERQIESFFSNPSLVTKSSIHEAYKKDGFYVLIDKQTEHVEFHRDLAGLQAGYFYYSEGSEIAISTNVHNLAPKTKMFNEEAIYQLIYFNYLWDGQTIYKDINQIEVGGFIQFSQSLSILKRERNQPEILTDENNLSDLDNIIALREEIVKAHKPYVNQKNIVFLSGGIDSVAMLIALDDLVDKSKIENHSFKVSGTLQDETTYAESIANHLGVDIKIIERDLSNEINREVFYKQILEMNNPYPGMWIFGNQVSNYENVTYYAGQDTRLHTPALNILDTLAFEIFALSKKGLAPFFVIFDLLLTPLRIFLDFIHSKRQTSNKIFLGLKRASRLFNTEKYVKLVYFKVDKANILAFKLPKDHINQIFKKYNFSLIGINNKRTLYNKIVSKKWIEQYVNDMRYMIDMVSLQGGKLAMPFYDFDLALFSASIPFELSIKKMKGKSQFGDQNVKINKYVLREALANKIDPKTYLRSKAVSRTDHLIFKQSFDTLLKTIIKEDINSSNSFVKSYKLNSFLERFLENQNDWVLTDDKYLLKVYYIACLIVYKQNMERQ